MMRARSYSRPITQLITALAIGVLMLGSTPTPSLAATSLAVPFAPNETWYVYDGYNNGPCHFRRSTCGSTIDDEYYAFDLVYDNGTGNPRLSGGRDVYAPTSGKVTYKSSLISGMGVLMKILADDGSYVHVYHVQDVPSAVAVGSRINSGAFIGHVYTAHSSGINHVHIQVTNSSGISQPLTIAGKYFRDRGGANQWRYTTFKNNAAYMPGDTNKSGKVDIQDYTILFENYSKTKACGNVADFNFDCNVNLSDYTLLYDYFGESSR